MGIAYNGAVYIYFVASLVMCLSAPHFPVANTEQNSLSPVGKYKGSGSFQFQRWVKVKHNGPRSMRVPVGDRVEIECDVSGSPFPSVQWLHAGRPMLQSFDESNSIGGVKLGTTKSRLILNCVTPHHQGTYTCIGMSSTHMVTSSPITIHVEGRNLTSLLPACSQEASLPPRVVTWRALHMETIGNDVTLSCVAIGNPLPHIYWFSGDTQELISPETQFNDRYKVLETGELLISNLRWEDMGSYTCVAENPLGRDSESTFIYPLAED